jgi:hypothetical protein
MSKFWQNRHSKLQWVKKIVPEPWFPTSGASSPKCALKLDTQESLPVLQYPVSPDKRSTPHFLGQSLQDLRRLAASAAFFLSKPFS